MSQCSNYFTSEKECLKSLKRRRFLGMWLKMQQPTLNFPEWVWWKALKTAPNLSGSDFFASVQPLEGREKLCLSQRTSSVLTMVTAKLWVNTCWNKYMQYMAFTIKVKLWDSLNREKGRPLAVMNVKYLLTIPGNCVRNSRHHLVHILTPPEQSAVL